jgi:hypothetical protein
MHERGYIGRLVGVLLAVASGATGCFRTYEADSVPTETQPPTTLAATPTPISSSTATLEIPTVSSTSFIPRPTGPASPTFVLKPTQLPIPITATPTSTPEADLESGVYPGEFTKNDIRGGYYDDWSWREMIARLLEEYGEFQGNPNRINSTLTSLFNPFGRGVHSDPLLEPGLGQTQIDIDRYGFINSLYDSAERIRVDELAHMNENGLWTIGIYGAAHERDAMLAVLAIAMNHWQDPNSLRNADGSFMTLAQALNNPDLRPTLRYWQDLFVAEIQERSLPVSNDETERRQNSSLVDLSGCLHPDLRESDQWVSCDVFRPNAQSRGVQLQSTRGVSHLSGGEEIFAQSDTEQESLLLILAIDRATGVWDVDGFTDRAYSPYGDSASGEELRPCGQTQVQPRPTAASQFEVPVSPPPAPIEVSTQPPLRPTEVWPTAVPTNPHLIPTATAGQPPAREATATDVP